MTTEAERLLRAAHAWENNLTQLGPDMVSPKMLRDAAAEIKRLGAENSRWIGLADRWAQECKREQRLSFRDQVGKLEAEIERLKKANNAFALLAKSQEERISTLLKSKSKYEEATATLQSERDANATLTAEIERKDDLLRQALCAMELFVDEPHYRIEESIAAIKQHLGEV